MNRNCLEGMKTQTVFTSCLCVSKIWPHLSYLLVSIYFGSNVGYRENCKIGEVYQGHGAFPFCAIRPIRVHPIHTRKPVSFLFLSPIADLSYWTAFLSVGPVIQNHWTQRWQTLSQRGPEGGKSPWPLASPRNSKTKALNQQRESGVWHNWNIKLHQLRTCLWLPRDKFQIQLIIGTLPR